MREKSKYHRLSSCLLRPVLAICVHGVFLSTVTDAQGQPDRGFPAEQVAFFEQSVLPVLRQNCFPCHGGRAEVESGFRITSRTGILQGGELGPAFDKADPGRSELLAAINYESVEMPPAGRLPREQIELITQWVKLGLPWSKVDDYGVLPASGSEARGDGRDYWAYQQLERPALPEVKDRRWVTSPMDAFVLAQLEAAGMAPAPRGDKVTLIRRAYYDLTGLPPSPEDVDRFVQDRSPDAFPRLVDRLLESPQYGEHWGRHWLDLVRYAETHGYERDAAKPEAWRFRDYVIRSFNDDKPYDQFVIEQLAGDELPQVTMDTLTATGFYRLGLWDDEPVDREQARYDGLDDIVKTTAEVVLGMTMGCVRCHSHKADPIDQREYYQFLAYFHDISYPNRENLRRWLTDEDRAELKQNLRQKADRESQLSSDIRAIETEFRRQLESRLGVEAGDSLAAAWEKHGLQILGAEGMKKLVDLRQQLERSRNQELAPAGTPIMSVAEEGRRPVHVLVRGNAHAEGELVTPGVPAVLQTEPPRVPDLPSDAPSSGKRLALAKWMFQDDNPLTARVVANRIWQYHFGRGIVPTPNDFGKLGEPPTHPRLLDWMACEIRDGGWRMKRIHRMILLSSTWRMASRSTAEALAPDPGNRLFGRFNMRRLSAEEIRDSILAVTGELNLRQGGPSVYVPIPQAVLQGQSRPGDGWGQASPEEAARRSIYIHVKRSLLVPILQMHDQADTDASCPVRYVTTVPTQSLGMLNGEFTNERAAKLAQRLDMEFPGDVPGQVTRTIRLTTGRTPTADEVAQDAAFIASVRDEHGWTPRQALQAYCLMILNTNEFVYLD